MTPLNDRMFALGIDAQKEEVWQPALPGSTVGLWLVLSGFFCLLVTVHLCGKPHQSLASLPQHHQESAPPSPGVHHLWPFKKHPCCYPTTRQTGSKYKSWGKGAGVMGWLWWWSPGSFSRSINSIGLRTSIILIQNNLSGHFQLCAEI